MNIQNSVISTRFNILLQKFTNLLTKNGKKTLASKVVFNMLCILEKKIKKEQSTSKIQRIGDKEYKEHRTPMKNLEKNDLINVLEINFQLLRIISQAIENITPSLEVRKVRVAGSTYLVPASIPKKKQETLALKWLIESTKKRQKNSKLNFSTCLADEILDASRKTGGARQKRDELHRLAQMNRAYIRYRWW